jgi:hypothetical protein
VSQVPVASEMGSRPMGRLSLRAAQGVLAAAMLTACGLLTYFYAWQVYGRDGVVASVSAAAVCWAGAGLAMSLSGLFRQPERALAMTAVGMALRMGLPLVAVLVVAVQGGALAEARFVIYILAYYLVALVVETWLTVKLVSTPQRAEAH